MCCTRLAGNAGPKKSPKIGDLGTISQICWAISSQLKHYRQSEKNLLNSNISPTCSHNMANFGLQTSEIFSGVWGTPANFNGFLVLAALLHVTLVGPSGREPIFAKLNRGRHLYSARRVSRCALAHILVFWFDNMRRKPPNFCQSGRQVKLRDPSLTRTRLAWFEGWRPSDAQSAFSK